MRMLEELVLLVGMTVIGLVNALGNLLLGSPRATGGLALVAAAGAIACGLAATGSAFILAWSLLGSLAINTSVQDRLLAADARSMVVEVVDRDQSSLGVLHPRASPTNDYVQPRDLWAPSATLQDLIDTNHIDPDHSSVHLTPAEVPPYFWACLAHMEDRQQGSWREPKGVDWLAPVSAVTGQRGASTLPMQIARVMAQRPPYPDEPLLELLDRKWIEVSSAPPMWRLLGNRRSAPGLQVWSAEHVNLAMRLGSGNASDIPSEIYGVQTASRILFGRTASELTPAQQIVLAGAYKAPLILARPNPELNPGQQASAAYRWKRVTQRVEALCAGNPKIIPSQAAGRVRAELARMRAAPPMAHIDPNVLDAILQLGAVSGAKVSRTRLEHPYALLRQAMPRPHRRFVTDQFLEHYGKNWRDQLRRVGLTTSAPEDLKFQGEMSASWRAFRETHSGGWLVSPGSGQMGYLAVAADLDGNIVRFFEGGDVTPAMAPRLSFDGGSARYDPFTNRGREEVGEQPRQAKCPPPADYALRKVCPFEPRKTPVERRGRAIASTGKVLAAIALADGGVVMTPELRSAFANSNTAVIAARLARLDQNRLAALAAAFDIQAEPGARLPTAISQGLADATPRQVQRLAAAAMDIASGEFDRPARLPSLVSHYGLYDPLLLTARTVTADPLDGAVDLRRLLIRAGGPSPQALQRFVAQALSAPACAGGTLRALRNWCPGVRPGVGMLLAKTGTRSVGGPGSATVDIWLTGAIRFTDGRAYTFVLLAGTDAPAAPFHTSLNAAAAAPVLARLLADLEASPSTPTPTHRPAVA